MSTLKRDYIWNTLGVFLQNLISPLLLVIVTRVNGIEDSGVFSFAFSVAVIFWAIAMWGGRTYQVSDVSQKFLRQSYVVTRFLLSGLVLAMAALFCILNGYDIIKTSILMSLVLVKVIEAVADAYYGVMQSNKKLYVSGQIMTAKYVVAIAAFAVTDVLMNDLVLSCFMFVLVVFLFLLFIDIPLTRKLDRSLKGDFVTKETLAQSGSLIKILTPVFLVTFLAMLSLNIPRYFIDIHHAADIGYFGILAMPVTLIILMMTFILQPNVLQLSTLISERRTDEFNRYVLRICGITLLVGLGVLGATALIGVPALELVFGVQFDEYYAPLILVVLAAIINAFVGIAINILVIMRIFKPQVFILVMTNVVLIGMCALLIPQGGMVAAMSLFMAANMAQVLMLGFVYRRVIGNVKKAS